MFPCFNMDDKFATAVALTIGLVEVVKKLGVPKEILPVASIIFGVLLTGLFNATNLVIPEVLIMGLITGLSGCGLFDLAKPPVVAALKLVKK